MEVKKRPKTVEDYQKLVEEDEAYKKTEAYQREVWEAKEDKWEQKAKREGRFYKRQPFVSALERQQQAERARQEEIAFLQERLKQLTDD